MTQGGGNDHRKDQPTLLFFIHFSLQFLLRKKKKKFKTPWINGADPFLIEFIIAVELIQNGDVHCEILIDLIDSIDLKKGQKRGDNLFVMAGLDVRVEQLSAQEVRNMMTALMERNKAQGQLLVAWKRRLKEQVNVIFHPLS